MDGNQMAQLIVVVAVILVLIALGIIIQVRRTRRQKRAWQQAQAADVSLSEWVRIEEAVRPRQNLYALPVLLLVFGWTGGLALMNYLSTNTGLAIAFGSGIVAIGIAAIISFKRARSRKLVARAAGYQNYEGTGLGLGWFISVFAINLGVVILLSPGGWRWVSSGFKLSGDNQSTAHAAGNSGPQIVTDSSGQLPATFPKDVPAYPGAKIIRTAELDGTTSLVMESADSTDAVANFYQTELKKNGWKIGRRTSKGDETYIQATKGKRAGLVIIRNEAGQREITVTDSTQ